MKITVVGINYAPELTGIGAYTSDMCDYLQSQGHSLTVITGFPYYPSWEIPRRYKGKLFVTEKMNNITLKRCPLYVKKNINARQRILHELSFLITSFFQLLRTPAPDLFLIISPPLGLGISAFIISRLKGAPFLFHVQDLQPDAAVSLGILRGNMLTGFLFRLEKFIYRRAKAISTISTTMKNRIISKGVAGGKIYVLPNWINIREQGRRLDGAPFRREHGLEDKFVYLYSGNVGKKQGLEFLIDVAAGIENSRIIFLIVGDGAHIAQLKSRAAALNVRNVLFLPLQPKERLWDMLAAADVCLVIQKKGVSDIVFPSKMINIMAAGRPALVTAEHNTELARTVLDNDAGFVARPENAASLRETILQAFQDKDLAQKGARAMQAAGRRFGRESVLKEFNRYLLSLG